MLMCPMLDDRNETISSRQYDNRTIWNRSSNEFGWKALLGDARGSNEVSSYAAPARAEDLGNLPPAFIDAGSAEVFETRQSRTRLGSGPQAVKPSCTSGREDSTVSRLPPTLRWQRRLRQHGSTG